MKKRPLEEGEEDEGTLAKRPRDKGYEDEDTYWTMLEEMRGEVESHLTLMDRFDLLRTRKDKFTEEAQRALLVDALWRDIFLPMYAGGVGVPRTYKDDDTMEIFDAFFRVLLAFYKNSENPRSITSEELDAVSNEEEAALLAPEHLKAFLQSLPLAALKPMYKNFIDDMSYAYAKSIGDWLQGLFYDRGQTLYDYTMAQESQAALGGDSRGRKLTELGIAICDINGRELYDLVFSLAPLADHVPAHWMAPTRALVPMLTVSRETRASTLNWARPLREVSDLERERVHACQQLLARLPYCENLVIGMMNLVVDGLTPLMRTLLLGVDAGLFVHFEYRIFEELHINTEHIADDAMWPTSANDEALVRSTSNQMGFRAIKKPEKKEEEPKA